MSMTVYKLFLEFKVPFSPYFEFLIKLLVESSHLKHFDTGTRCFLMTGGEFDTPIIIL